MRTWHNPLVRVAFAALLSVGVAAGLNAQAPSPQNQNAPSRRPGGNGQAGGPSGGGKPAPGQPGPGNQGRPQVQPPRPAPGNNRPPQTRPPQGGGGRPAPGRPSPGTPGTGGPGTGNQGRPPQANRPGLVPGLRPGGRPNRPPQWGRPPQKRPSYQFRPNDRAYLRRHYLNHLRAINFARRPVFTVGGFFPYGDIGYLTPLPPDLYGYLPPPPPGYDMGYFDGYVVVYDPVTYFIANLIDLAR